MIPLISAPPHALTAAHCNTLQHTATHCNTLQHTAAHCSTLQHTAAHYNTLQYTATNCITLQHTASHCNKVQTSIPEVPCTPILNEPNICILSTKHFVVTSASWALCSHTHARTHVWRPASLYTEVGRHCITLQHTATRCILQHTATHFNTRWVLRIPK